MKKITALLLAAVLLCCLTACGKSTEEPQPTTETTTQAPTEAGALQMIADAVIRQSGFEGVVMITQNGEVLAQSAVGAVEHVRHDRRLFSRFCLRRLDHDTKSAFHAFRTLYR